MAIIDNLVRYWKLDETSGTNATDSTGNQDGTYIDTYTLYQSGIINKAISVDNGYVVYSPRPFSSNMSFQIWFKTTDALSRRHFLLGNGYNALAINNSTDLVWFSNTSEGDSLLVTIGSSFNNGSWHHVVVTQSGTSASIYFDGSLIGSGTVASLSSISSTGRLGKYGGIPSQYYIGDIDEVGIWTKELSSEDVTSLWNSGSGLSYPFAASNISGINQITGVQSITI